MIAIDTSSLRRFLSGDSGPDVDLVRDSMNRGRAVLPPVVVCELLSDPTTPRELVEDISLLPVLETVEGFWIRAGLLRAQLIASGHKAKLADVLIAQCCIDHNVPLVTHDRDFRHFAQAGLTLL